MRITGCPGLPWPDGFDAVPQNQPHRSSARRIEALQLFSSVLFEIIDHEFRRQLSEAASRQTGIDMCNGNPHFVAEGFFLSSLFPRPGEEFLSNCSEGIAALTMCNVGGQGRA